MSNDFILHIEELGHVLVEALGPEMVAALGVDELRTDAHPVAAALHGTFQHIAHAEFAADLPEIDMLSLVGEGRVATDHQHAAHARQVGGQAFGHAIDEIFLLGIATYVCEGQHPQWKVAAGLTSPVRLHLALRVQIPSKALELPLANPPRPTLLGKHGYAFRCS
jgi:hypothetical protein